MDISGWKEFEIGQVFPNIVKPKVYHAREVELFERGIPYIVRSKFNNGIKARVKRPIDIINPRGVISFGAENSSFFYQEEEWISGRDIYYIDTTLLSKYACYFIITCLEKIAKNYSYNYGLFPELLKKEKIKLPVDSAGLPNWNYMEDYIESMLNEIDLGIGHYSKIESNSLPYINISHWKKFKIDELFTQGKPISRSQLDYDDGNIPFVASGNYNNGILKYVSPKENEKLDRGNCITISPVDGSTFFQENDFLGRGGGGSSIIILYNEYLNKYNGYFIATVIRKVCSYYFFGDMGNQDTICQESIRLPVTKEGEPDFEYMTNYMKNVENCCIGHVKSLKNISM